MILCRKKSAFRAQFESLEKLENFSRQDAKTKCIAAKPLSNQGFDECRTLVISTNLFVTFV